MFVISGKEQAVLQEAFAELPHVGLAAEHGFVFRWPAPVQRKGSRAAAAAAASARAALPQGTGTPSLRSSAGHQVIPESLSSSTVNSVAHVDSAPSPAASVASAGGAPARGSAASAASSAEGGDNGMPWEDLTPEHVSVDWMALAQGIMDTYAARTNGTYILRKSSALSWHYGDADPEFGSMQAKELQDHLTGVLAAYAVNVLSGQGYVEVRPKGVHKGAVLALIMDRLEGRDRPQQQHGPGAAPAAAPEGPSRDSHAGREASNDVPAAAAAAAAPPALSVRRSDTADSLGNAGATAAASGVTPRKPRPLEFILTIGDDLADEEMFSTVQVSVFACEEGREAHGDTAVVCATAAGVPARADV